MTGFRIGFTGYKNSGKTHISTKLQEYSPTIKAIGFSDPLYACLYEAAGITLEEIQDKSRREIPDERLGGKSIQYALNTLGSDWGRGMIHENIWTNRAFSKSELGKYNLFDNVRFLNELDGVRKGTGSVVFGIWNERVKNDGTYPESFVMDIMKKADFIIDNTDQAFAKNKYRIHELMIGIQAVDLGHGLGMFPEECFPSVEGIYRPKDFDFNISF
uniref:Deoxynucleoside monophosphate kinase n=1 Tax=Ochrobactrum phage ORM_20 TaxID=2985243 RepID=A0A9N6X009_9VIRU|nr:deoxynucleoside monophosphate kinase [Ochrobactrum phage ORM_20]